MEAYYRQSNRPERTPAPRRKRRRRVPRTLLFTGLMLLIGLIAVAVYLLFFNEREKTISMDATPITAGMTKLNTGSGMLYQTDGICFCHSFPLIIKFLPKQRTVL